MLQDDFLELKARESAEPPVGLEANYKTVKNQGRYTVSFSLECSSVCPGAHQCHSFPSLDIGSPILSPKKKSIINVLQIKTPQTCFSIWGLGGGKQCSDETSSHLNSNYGSRPSGMISLRESLKSTSRAENNTWQGKHLASLVLNIPL